MVTARFWRIRVTEHPGGWLSLMQVQFQNASGINMSNNPANAIGSDGPVQAAFTPTSPGYENPAAVGTWLGYDFGTPVTVERVALTASTYPYEMATAWVIEYADAPGAWVQYAEIRDSAAWANNEIRQYEIEQMSFPVIKTLTVQHQMPLPPLPVLTGTWVDVSDSISSPLWRLDSVVDARWAYDPAAGALMVLVTAWPLTPHDPAEDLILHYDFVADEWTEDPRSLPRALGTGQVPTLGGVALVTLGGNGPVPPEWWTVPLDASETAEQISLTPYPDGLASILDDSDPAQPILLADINGPSPQRVNLLTLNRTPLTPWEHAATSAFAPAAAARDPATGLIYATHEQHFAAYDPAADEWRILPDAPLSGIGRGMVCMHGHVILFGGDDNGSLAPIGDTWFYSPARNQWLPGPTMPEPSSLGMYVVLDNDSLLYMGGQPDAIGPPPWPFPRQRLDLQLLDPDAGAIKHLDVTYTMLEAASTVVKHLNVRYGMPGAMRAVVTRYLAATYHLRDPDVTTVVRTLHAHYRMHQQSVSRLLLVEYDTAARTAPQDPTPGPPLPPYAPVPPPAAPGLLNRRIRVRVRVD